MIKQAYLVGRAGIAAHAEVGGMPALLRQVLALQDAGVERITLINISADCVRGDARVRLSVEQQRGQEEQRQERLRLCTPEGAETLGRASAKARAGGGAPAPVQKCWQANLIACAGCVWHPSLVKRLARLPIGSAGVCVAGDGDASTYVCDGDHVSAVLAGMRDDEAPPLDRSSVPNVPLRPGEFVICPRTEAERRQATTLLLRSLDKPSDGLVSRHLHRRISRVVTRWLLPTSITPNAMTLVAALFGIVAVPIALTGGYWNILLGAVLFETQNILDGCDGEIARLKYLRSRSGEWLDQVLDDVLNIAFLAAVGTALSGARGWIWTLTLVCMAAQIVHVIGLYAGLIFKAGGRGSVATLRWRVDRPGAGRRTLGDLTRRDLYSLLYVVCAVFNVMLAAFLWHAAITIGSAVVTTVQWIAWNGPEFYAGEGATDPAGELIA